MERLFPYYKSVMLAKKINNYVTLQGREKKHLHNLPRQLLQLTFSVYSSDFYPNKYVHVYKFIDIIYTVLFLYIFD